MNDYTYAVEIDWIKFEKEPGTEEMKDETKVFYTEPYGLDNCEEILFYLPEAPVQELPEEYKDWVKANEDLLNEQLSFYGLYNVKGEQGFSSYEKPTIYDELEFLEQLEVDLKKKLQTESCQQTEMTEITLEIYQMWDSELNQIWSRLMEEQEGEVPDTLLSEEREWIDYKEAEMQKAGAEFEGGSLQSMAEYGKGAELTKERVYELAEYISE